MAKANKPNQQALRTEARERTRQSSAESAGGRFNEGADVFEEVDRDETRSGEMRGGDMRGGESRGEPRRPDSSQGGMTGQMKEKKGNQPPTRPKR
jgi:hypothetical protein